MKVMKSILPLLSLGFALSWGSGEASAYHPVALGRTVGRVGVAPFRHGVGVGFRGGFGFPHRVGYPLAFRGGFGYGLGVPGYGLGVARSAAFYRSAICPLPTAGLGYRRSFSAGYGACAAPVAASSFYQQEAAYGVAAAPCPSVSLGYSAAVGSCGTAGYSAGIGSCGAAGSYGTGIGAVGGCGTAGLGFGGGLRVAPLPGCRGVGHHR